MEWQMRSPTWTKRGPRDAGSLTVLKAGDATATDSQAHCQSTMVEDKQEVWLAEDVLSLQHSQVPNLEPSTRVPEICS